MNKQRLLELAGIGANMSNPSQEPYSEIPAASENPIGAAGTAGYAEVGDAGVESTMDRIREEARKGADNPDQACACCEVILTLMDDGEDDGEEI